MRYYQSNRNLSPGRRTLPIPRRSGRERPPLGQGGRASLFELVPADEVTLLVELIVEGGVDRCELLHFIRLNRSIARSRRRNGR